MSQCLRQVQVFGYVLNAFGDIDHWFADTVRDQFGDRDHDGNNQSKRNKERLIGSTQQATCLVFCRRCHDFKPVF